MHSASNWSSSGSAPPAAPPARGVVAPSGVPGRDELVPSPTRLAVLFEWSPLGVAPPPPPSAPGEPRPVTRARFFSVCDSESKNLLGALKIGGECGEVEKACDEACEDESGEPGG